MIQNELALNAGVIFDKTYKILFDTMNEGVNRFAAGDKDAMVEASLFVSVCVNGVFACELYLKSMLDPSTRGHNLKQLFEKLNATEQSNIIAKTVEGMKAYNRDYDLNKFSTDLVAMKEGFEDWRYFYQREPGETNHLFYGAFMEAIREVAKAERQLSADMNST